MKLTRLHSHRGRKIHIKGNRREKHDPGNYGKLCQSTENAQLSSAFLKAVPNSRSIHPACARFCIMTLFPALPDQLRNSNLNSEIRLGHLNNTAFVSRQTGIRASLFVGTTPLPAPPELLFAFIHWLKTLNRTLTGQILSGCVLFLIILLRAVKRCHHALVSGTNSSFMPLNGTVLQDLK